MARFYDAVDDNDLGKVETLLKQGGIMYTLRIVESETKVKEIHVAEEDLAEAEKILCGPAHNCN